MRRPFLVMLFAVGTVLGFGSGFHSLASHRWGSHCNRWSSEYGYNEGSAPRDEARPALAAVTAPATAPAPAPAPVVAPVPAPAQPLIVIVPIQTGAPVPAAASVPPQVLPIQAIPVTLPVQVAPAANPAPAQK